MASNYSESSERVCAVWFRAKGSNRVAGKRERSRTEGLGGLRALTRRCGEHGCVSADSRRGFGTTTAAAGVSRGRA